MACLGHVGCSSTVIGKTTRRARTVGLMKALASGFGGVLTLSHSIDGADQIGSGFGTVRGIPLTLPVQYALPQSGILCREHPLAAASLRHLSRFGSLAHTSPTWPGLPGIGMNASVRARKGILGPGFTTPLVKEPGVNIQLSRPSMNRPLGQFPQPRGEPRNAAGSRSRRLQS